MEKALEWLERYHMIREGETVIVGVSGGADSVCLLFVLKKYQELHPFTMEVVHVEHGIRGQESLEDAGFVKELCDRLKVPFHLEQKDVKALAAQEGLSVEEAGRMARYAAFEEWRQKTGGCAIAVAHHANDQAETILWNLIRGSGVRGMSGIQPVNGYVIRPLLGCTREEIEAWLREQQICYRTDRTNLEDTYTRNKLRLKVLPYLEQECNPRACAHIAMAGERLRKVEDYLEGQACRRAEKIGRFSEGESRLERKGLLEEAEILQEYLLRYAIQRTGAGLKDISSGHVERLQRLAAGRSGTQLDLPGRLKGVCSGPWLILTVRKQEEGQVPHPVSVPIPGEANWAGFRIQTRIEEYRGQIIPQKKYTKWFDYDTIKDTIQLRSRQSGDYFIGDSLGGRRKLKKYFIDEKIPREEREQIPLLAEGSHIIWCVGYRISEAYKITKETRRMLVVDMLEVKDGR